MKKVPPFRILDVFRALAALWVVMDHACLEYVFAHKQLLHNPLYFASIYGRLGVVVFFVISGYCIFGASYSSVVSGKSVAQYFADRIRPIYPPYFAALVAAVIIELGERYLRAHHLGGGGSGRSLNFDQPAFWVANIFILQPEFGQPCILTVFWSLAYEIIFYGIIGLILLAATQALRQGTVDQKINVLFIGTNLVNSVSIGWLVISPSSCPFPIDLWYQFGIGALLFQIIARKMDVVPARPTAAATAFLAAPIFVGCLALTIPHLPFYTARDIYAISGGVKQAEPVQAGICLIFTVFLYLIWPCSNSLAKSKYMQPLLFIGVMSYSLYLIHRVPETIVNIIMLKLHFSGSLYFVTYIAEIVASIPAAYLFFLLFERRFISSAQKKIQSELAQPPVQPVSEVPASTMAITSSAEPERIS